MGKKKEETKQEVKQEVKPEEQKSASEKLADPKNKSFLKAEAVGKEAAENLMKEISSGAAVDKHLADQLIPFMALAGGIIKASEVTNHVKSNIYVAEKFLDVKFTIKDNIISCEKKTEQID